MKPMLPVIVTIQLEGRFDDIIKVLEYSRSLGIKDEKVEE